jgi:hypothetical protein
MGSPIYLLGALGALAWVLSRSDDAAPAQPPPPSGGPPPPPPPGGGGGPPPPPASIWPTTVRDGVQWVRDPEGAFALFDHDGPSLLTSDATRRSAEGYDVGLVLVDVAHLAAAAPADREAGSSYEDGHAIMFFLPTQRPRVFRPGAQLALLLAGAGGATPPAQLPTS